MTAREVILKALRDSLGGDRPGVVEHVLDALKAEGLFIGPLVPTPEMINACNPQDKSDVEIIVGMWHRTTEEWLRSEGA